MTSITAPDVEQHQNGSAPTASVTPAQLARDKREKRDAGIVALHLAEPDLSQRVIADRLGTNLATVNRAIKAQEVKAPDDLVGMLRRGEFEEVLAECERIKDAEAEEAPATDTTSTPVAAHAPTEPGAAVVPKPVVPDVTGEPSVRELVGQVKARIKVFASSRSKVPPQEVAEMVASLQRVGLSVPGIVAATGFSHDTVQLKINGRIADAAFWAYPRLRVHPAAQLLPMMGDTELDELARDIKANGLMEPIILWRESVDADQLFLLDGRNRWAALQRLGITNPFRAPPGPREAIKPVCIIDGVDPTTFVLSANVHRRHLTSGQKRAAIEAYLKADPTVSDRQVAKELGVSDKTVGAERKDLEGRAEIPHVETRTDSAGRSQPAKKPKPKPTPHPEDEPCLWGGVPDPVSNVVGLPLSPDTPAAELLPEPSPAAKMQARNLSSVAKRIEAIAGTARHERGVGMLLTAPQAQALLECIRPPLAELNRLREWLDEKTTVPPPSRPRSLTTKRTPND